MEKCNSDQCLCQCKKCHVGEKDYIWYSATCSCQNGKYSASIIDDSAITSDEILTQNVSSTIKKQKLSHKF